MPRDDRTRARPGPRRDRPHHLQPPTRAARPHRVLADDCRGARAPCGRARALTMLRPFTLHRPETAEEACALLARLGEDAAPYAGGTELLLLMKLGLLRPPHLVDVKRIRELGALSDGGRLTIGATVTHRALERSALVREHWPLVASVARHVANVGVRNVGTVGGTLAGRKTG